MANRPAPISGPNPSGVSAESILAALLYRDSNLLILNKPAGLAVHPGPRGGASLEDFFDSLRFGVSRSPALAHRLDRDTSGCLVLGRHRKALARLGKLFANGQVEKTYWAIVRGAPPQESGVIDLALQKRNWPGGWTIEPNPAGQVAQTHYRVVGKGVYADMPVSWLELKPRTGRTHQIRVHCASLGCAVLGDPHYGPKDASLPLHLHAHAIAFPYKLGQPLIGAQAPPPNHMIDALSSCGWG
jgi:tRNA pseudouridine32 synthase / 23S rRNA pseudouridine746 synthase